MAVTVEQFTEVQQTINALNDKLDGLKGMSERMEAVEKQLEDAQRIIKEKKEKRIITDRDEAFDFTQFKGVPEDWTFKDIHENIFAKNPGDNETIKVAQTIYEDLWILNGVIAHEKKIPITQLNYWDSNPKHLVPLIGSTTPREFMEKTGLGKALNTATGSGGYWIPTGWADEMITDYRQELLVEDVFTSFEMPTDPFKFPFLNRSGLTVYVRSEPTSNDPSNYEASQVSDSEFTFETDEFAVRTVYTRKLEEDALTMWLPELKKAISYQMARAVESGIINGDTSTTHQDSDVTASDDYRKVWTGLRKTANTESTEYNVQSGGSSFQTSDFMEVQAKMEKYGVPTSRCVWLLSNKAYILARAFDELETFEKAGARATIFTGQIGILYGWPVIVSPEIREDLATTGKYTGTGSHTEFLGVHYPSFRIGYRREEDIETDRDVKAGVTDIVVTMRLQFKKMQPTGETVVGAGINVE